MVDPVEYSVVNLRSFILSVWEKLIKTLKNASIDKVNKLLANWKWFALKWSASCSLVSDSLPPYGLQPTRLLCPWDSPGNDTKVGCIALLQGISLIQESNLCLPLAPELQAEKATHSSNLAWRIPWTGRKESDRTERLSLSLSVPLSQPIRKELYIFSWKKDWTHKTFASTLS